ncbi:MAG: hypothetical protein ABIY62_09620 [Ginsengibacter sp.]
MKTKILLSVALFFITLATHAQINKGEVLLGGSIRYSDSKNIQVANSKYESLYTNVQIGKVLKENSVAGIILSYDYSKGYSPYTRINEYGAGVFYRKYKSLLKNIYLFGEGDAEYFYSKNISGYFVSGQDGQRYITQSISINFTPGIAYSVCKKIQMELLMQNLLTISYAHTNSDYTSSTAPSLPTIKGNNFQVNANLNSNLLYNFGIGFKFLLGK